MTTSWVAGVRREVLPNGLTLLVQPNTSAAVAAVITHVRAGFFDEPDALVGVSHVLEHMFFKGTPTRGVGVIPRETRALGGYLNAGTGYDATVYYAVFPAESTDRAVAIQADALQHATIDAEELARELQVIVQEVKRKRDSPAAVTAETLFAVLHRRHRIRRWRIGEEDHLARLTRDDVRGYYRSRYVPRRTIVSLVGDVDPDRTLDELRRAYAGWADRATTVEAGPAEPEESEPRAKTLIGDVVQAHLACGWRTVPPLDPMAVPLELAAGLLSSGRGSWLYQALRAPGTVATVGAYQYAPTELGVFGVTAELAPERLRAALAGVAGQVARLRTRPVGEDDLERTRALLTARWARRMETMDGRATALASAEALGGIHLLDEDYARLVSTTAAEVEEAAYRFLSPERLGAVVYLPTAYTARLDLDEIRETFRAVPSPPSNGRPASVTLAPRPGSRTAPTHRGEVAVALAHGCDVVAQRKIGVPLVTVGVFLPRADVETLAEAGCGTLTVRSAVRGAGGHDAQALAFASERLGGVLSPRAGADWFGFSVTVAAARLGEGAALLRLLLSEATLGDEAIRDEQAALVEEARLRTDDMVRYPFQLAFGAAFGDRGYGVPVDGVPESLEALRPEDVRRRYAILRTAGRPVVVAVGDVAPDAAVDVLAGVFDDLPQAAGLPRPPAAGWRRGEAVRVRERAKRQTAFAMVYPGPGRRSPARYAADVWAAIAGGLGGELFVALRDRRSLAYTVMATAWQRLGAGALATYIATSPERTAEAREQLDVELARYAERLVDADTVDRAIRYVVGQWVVGRQRAATVASELADAWLAGEPVESVAETPDRYRAVTAEAVRAVCRAAFTQPAVVGMVKGTGA